VLLECRAGQRLVAEVHPGGEQRGRLHAFCLSDVISRGS
jgi:hypothetical protein